MAPIEALAARLHEAAEAWGGPRRFTWLDAAAGPVGHRRTGAGGWGESVLTAFPRALRRWTGPADGDLGAFLDGLSGTDRAAADADPHAPRFRGGWIGFLAYEAVAALEPVKTTARRDLDVPLASWAHHDVWFRHVPDAGELELWCCGDQDGPAEPGSAPRPELSAWMHWAEEALRAPADHTTPMWQPPPVLRRRPSKPGAAASLVAAATSSLTRDGFVAAVHAVQGAIRDGEVFQANLAQRVSLPARADPFEAYVQLRRLNPSPFACFIQEEWGALVSNSPERLFRLHAAPAGPGRRVSARPIAGTCPRFADHAMDAAAVEALRASAKERAEHTMLVDLVRNDVGRVAAPGSVRVGEFQVVEAYSHVHHLVSDVEGSLRDDVSLRDVVRAMFPGGTITGAPKLRSIEVIDRHEPVMRGPYTGSAGYVNPDMTADWNILIRTIVWTRDRLNVYAGAGIVADSDPAHEYDETLHKAAAMLEACAMVQPEGPAGGNSDAPAPRLVAGGAR